MRNVITIANVTTNAIVNRTVRTVLAGVDALRASLEAPRLYAAPAAAALESSAPASGTPDWAQGLGDKPMAGKPKFAGAGTGSMRCQHEQLSCSRRAHSRCRRPRLSSCLRELS
jgi:hypothetical protein